MRVVPVKRHDVGVPFEDTLTYGSNNQPVDLSDALDIKFILRRPKGAVIVGDAVIRSPATGGTVSYTSVAGDLAICGDHQQEWQVTWTDKVLTFPDEGYNIVRVTEDLNDA